VVSDQLSVVRRRGLRGLLAKYYSCGFVPWKGMVIIMSRDISDLFSWKSRATRERDAQEFEAWALPHGQKQRENLEALLRTLNPKEKISMSVYLFLTCKELYADAVKRTGSREAATDYILNKGKINRRLISPKEITTFLACVLADAEIDERCEYPSADEVRAHIAELDELRGK